MSSGSVRNVAEPQSANPIQLLKQATAAKERACDWMLDNQHLDGYWCGELEGDTILESEYVLLLAWMGKLDDPIVSECAEYIRQQQLPDGGWGLYPGAPLEISASVKSYWVLKMVGDAPDSEHMLRARTAILAAGGAEKVNSFTRYYLALLGIISYQQCPAVPPELVLLPNWFPVNIYKMSSWSRTIVVPLSLLWAFQPRTELPAEHKIDEIFVKSPEELSMTMPKAGSCLERIRMVPPEAVSSSGCKVCFEVDDSALRPERWTGGHFPAHYLERDWTALPGVRRRF